MNVIRIIFPTQYTEWDAGRRELYIRTDLLSCGREIELTRV